MPVTCAISIYPMAPHEFVVMRPSLSGWRDGRDAKPLPVTGERPSCFLYGEFFGREQKMVHDRCQMRTHRKPGTVRIAGAQRIHDRCMLVHDRTNLGIAGLRMQQGAFRGDRPEMP